MCIWRFRIRDVLKNIKKRKMKFFANLLKTINPLIQKAKQMLNKVMKSFSENMTM